MDNAMSLETQSWALAGQQWRNQGTMHTNLQQSLPGTPQNTLQLLKHGMVWQDLSI